MYAIPQNGVMFNRGIFRKEALERLSTPEQLDQLMQVTGGMSWLFLSTLGTLILSGLIWCVFGRIPITVDGKGILIRPKQIIPLQSPISGQLASWEVGVGDCVEKNAVLATIDPSELKQQLRASQDKRLQLDRQNQETLTLSRQQKQLEERDLLSSQGNLTRQLQNARALTPQLQRQRQKAIAEQRRSLEEQLENSRQLTLSLQNRLERWQTLQKQGAISQETVLDAEREYLSTRQSIADLEAQLTQLKVEETEIQREYQDNLANIDNLQGQLQELSTARKRLDRETLDLVNNQSREIQEVSREIAQLQQQIAENSTIRSPLEGCILEIILAEGQVVQPGSQLGNLQILVDPPLPLYKGGGEETSETLVAVNYFALKDGKIIKPGMPMQITPDTVKRERFGGIVGKVTKISAFPVTLEAVTLSIGNREVAASLLVPTPDPGQDPTQVPTAGAIEAIGELQPSDETFSGWQWSSSQGPQQEITSGTTFTSRVQVEERAPITFVLPILREWTGVY